MPWQPQNNPLFVEKYGDDDTDMATLHSICHCALDVVEERMKIPKGALFDAFLGLLYPTEDFRVFGYVSNSQVKIMAVVREEDEVKDSELRLLFRGIHAAFVDQVSNPFYSMGTPITSNAFRMRVSALVYGQLR